MLGEWIKQHIFFTCFPQASALCYVPITAILILESVVYTGCVSLPNSHLFLNFYNLTSYYHTIEFPLLVTSYLPWIFVPFLSILLDFLLHWVLLTTGADTLENICLAFTASFCLDSSFSDLFSFLSDFSCHSISIPSYFLPHAYMSSLYFHILLRQCLFFKILIFISLLDISIWCSTDMSDLNNWYGTAMIIFLYKLLFLCSLIIYVCVTITHFSYLLMCNKLP